MMILNEFEYLSTKERLEGFKRALAMLNAPDNELKKKKPVMWKLNIDALHYMIDEVTAQMQEYEELINCNENTTFELTRVEDLPRVLVKARIASKISQAEMAEHLGVSLKQFQRFEDWNYQEATLPQLVQVGEILGILIQPTAISFNQSLKAGR